MPTDEPRSRDLAAGLVATLPFVPGVMVLGAIWGASAGAAGIGQLSAVALRTRRILPSIAIGMAVLVAAALVPG